jgi:hypothetical protein
LRRRLSPGLPNFNPQYVTIFVSNQQILSRNFRIMKHRKYSGKSVAVVVGLQAFQTDYVCQAKTKIPRTRMSTRRSIAQTPCTPCYLRVLDASSPTTPLRNAYPCFTVFIHDVDTDFRSMTP